MQNKINIDLLVKKALKRGRNSEIAKEKQDKQDFIDEKKLFKMPKTKK